jgi:uncharacterized membrane protein
VNRRQRPHLTSPRSAALRLSQRKRVGLGAGLGAVVGTVFALFAPWQLALLMGWDATALFCVISVWMFIPALDGGLTKSTARRQDLSNVNDDIVILVASLISLVGVLLTLVAAKDMSGAIKATMTTVAVATVVVSWTTVQTVFSLRYARLYYDEPEGGVDFNDDLTPDYLDFVYLAFTVGMTFQVSDTDVSDQAIRRAITRHALLSYVFATIIIGITINVVGGLI